jgi:hypothetical protein
MNPKDLEFRITKEDDGSLAASCINEDIFTQGSDLEGLKSNIGDAIRVHFSDSGVREFYGVSYTSRSPRRETGRAVGATRPESRFPATKNRGDTHIEGV